jgi:uncharacterized membrane protein
MSKKRRYLDAYFLKKQMMFILDVAWHWVLEKKIFEDLFISISAIIIQ